jgi:hypothetical protein
MLRFAPVFLALGLAVLWVIGLAEDSTTWLTWVVGALVIPMLATTGLVPERQASAWAALCLALLALALAAAWLVGWHSGAVPWLTWWTLAFGVMSLATASGVALQERIDGLRARPLI